MNNFAIVAWIDPFDLAGSLRTRWGLFQGEALPIRMRREDGFVAAKETAKWPELSGVLSRIRRVGDMAGNGIEFGEIRMEMLSPGEVQDWRAAGQSEYARAELAIRTNPGCMDFSGIESLHLHVGTLAIINRAVPCSSINLGEVERIHLAVEFKNIMPGARSVAAAGDGGVG